MNPPPTESSRSHSKSDGSAQIGFLGDRWVSHDQMRLPIDDIGFRQGITVVERLRTYSGKIFSVDAHLTRWQHSAGQLGIDRLPSPETIKSRLDELLRRNDSVVKTDGDVGITMFATPGMSQIAIPTFGLHTNRLDHTRIERQIQQGQPIVVTDVQQPDPKCWPRSIKMRSRIHYYLADRMARQHHQDAVGMLLDGDQSVTETSIANIAIVLSGSIVSPPEDRILGGITQSVIEKLAAESAIAWTKRPITANEFSRASEILMMGTGAGIWFANSVNGQQIANGMGGRVYQTLRERFDAFVSAS